MVDNVNHPEHYEKTCSLECIQVMRLIFGDEALAYFCMGNAFKYMWRYKNKNGQEDLDKAQWYLDYVTHEGLNKALTSEDAALYKNLIGLLSKELLQQIVRSSREDRMKSSEERS